MIYRMLHDKYGSQEAVGRALGVSQNAVKRWKAGGGARRETIERIADNLKISVGEVYELWNANEDYKDIAAKDCKGRS